MSKGTAVLGYVVAGGMLAFFLSKKAAAKAAPASSGTVAPYNPFPLPAPLVTDPFEIPASMAPVGPVTVTAAVWSNLAPAPAPPAGFVNFPSGSQADTIFLPWAADGAGNLYTQWAGQIYIVNQVPDLFGNLTARLLGS